MEGTADIAGGHPEKRPHLAVDQGDDALGVDADGREWGRVQGKIPQLALPAHLAYLGAISHVEPHRHRLIPGHRHARPAAEYPLPHADDLKPLAVRQQHLGLAEEQVASLAQGEVEPVDDLRLRLDVEVHQRVTAHQQVEPGDRRIPGEVMPPEDHPAAQIRPEGEMGAVLLEVLFSHLVGERVERLRRVEARPRVMKGLVIDVGAVDLDPLRGFLDAQCLGEGYRQRIGFLAAGATRAPYADLTAAFRIREQLRHDLALQERPGLGVPEKSGDVDQDRIEQVAEFLGTALQLVPVIHVVRDARLLHPLADAPGQ